ncbi:MAG: choice-of-anchor D domain-containing protein [Chryseolinea sp.]
MKKTSTLKNGIVIPLLICFLFFQISSFCEASKITSTRTSNDGVPIGKISEDSDSIDFDFAYVGGAQWPIYVNVENHGTEPLIISSINSSADFPTKEFEGPVTVLPQDSYALYIEFVPTAIGPRSCSIQIFTNDPVNPVLIVYATGEGLEPPTADTVIRGRLFPDQQIHKTVNIKNTTVNDLDFRILFSLEPADQTQNSYHYETTFHLNSGEAVDVDIPINSTDLSTGQYYGSLYVENYMATVYIPVDWIILETPFISSNFDRSNFTLTTLTGQTSPNGKYINIANSNDVPLHYTVTKAYPGLDFVNFVPDSGTLGIHQSYEIPLQFNTKNLPAGTYPQELQVTIDDPALTVVNLKVTLHIIDGGPILSIESYYLSFDFGTSWVGGGNYPSCLDFTNTGSEPLVISQIVSTDPNFQVDTSGEPVTIPPFDTLSLNSHYMCIGFHPVEIGNLSGEILIFSNDPIHPIIRISLTGTGLPPPIVQTHIADTLLTNQKSTHTVTLQNQSAEPVEYFVYSNFSGFITNVNSTIALAPGETKDIEIELNATSGIGHFEAELNISGYEGRLWTSIPVMLDVLPTLDDFSLTYFKTGVVKSSFVDEVTLDVADPEIEKYTIQANEAGQKISSVKFMLDGRAINIDNSSPYTLDHWTLPVLSSGLHTITAQAFSKNNAHGEAYEIMESHILIINSATIIQFDVVDTNGNILTSLFDGDIINIGQPEFHDINIMATTNINTTRSVKFTLNGVTARIDNRAPYAISGSSNGYETPWNIRPGSYTLTATPYMKYYGWGPDGIPLTIHFTVVNNPSPSVNFSSGRESSDLSIQLINLEDRRSLTTYPNPVVDELHIAFSDASEGIFELRILNTNGQIVYHAQGSEKMLQGQTINTKHLGLASGVYYVQVISQNRSIEVRKIIKQ